jgi:CRP/FNR family transcriptional regulator
VSTQACADCVVRNRAICRALDAESLAEFSRSGRRRRLKAGETLRWQGDEDAPCATVISGAVKLSVVEEDGDERIVGLGLPSDFVGSPFDEASEITTTALTDCEVCLFPRNAFSAALESNRDLETELLKRTMADLKAARMSRSRSAALPARARIAALLLDLKTRGQGCAATVDPDYLELPLTRGEIAQFLDLRIETVSREFGALEEAGLIARQGRRGLRFLDEDGLRGLTEV